MTISEKQHFVKKTYSAKDYVQDGLIYQVDGIENSGYGQHEAVSGQNMKIPDLVSNGKKWLKPCWQGGVQFHDTHFTLDGTDISPAYGGYAPNEIILSPQADIMCQIIPAKQFEVVFSVADAESEKHAFSGGFCQNGIHISNGLIGCGDGKGYQISNDEIVSMSFKAFYQVNDCYWKNGMHDSIDQSIVDKGYGGVNNATLLGGQYQKVFDAKWFSFRAYDRELNASEIMHNFLVDKSRFEI